jgi:SAM-dependent methyltransferase
MTRDAAELQDRTSAHFDRAAAYWRDVYAEDSLQALVYRRRQELVLEWVDALALPAGSRVLEVGCGAGLATVELARRGFSLTSTDASGDMVELASRRVAESGVGGGDAGGVGVGDGVGDGVSVSVADVHALPYPSGSFALVVGLGVLPWLHSPERAVEELARVLAPGGHAIVTADNRLRLNLLVEPAESPLVVPLKYAWRVARRAARRARGRAGGHGHGNGTGQQSAVSRLHTPRRVDRMLVDAGLQPVRRTTVGFGPFTVLWRPVLGDRAGLLLDHRLGRLAERRVPRLRRTGWHYVVCARKD